MTSLEFFFRDLFSNPLTLTAFIITAVPVVIGLVYFLFSPKLVLLIFKNLGRNKLRTILTAVATMVLVFMVTLIWTVVFFLDLVTSEKSKDLKVIVTEKWQLPSQMPLTYGDYLNPKSPHFILNPSDVGPGDFMTWSFYGGTLDPTKRTTENLVFMFMMNPDHIRTMMDDLDNLDPALVQKLKEKRNGVLMGQERMRTINRGVGQRFKLTSINYRGIDLEFEIVGALPEGRYDKTAIGNTDYFNNEIDRYKGEDGKGHPLSSKRLNLIWLRVPSKEAFQRVAQTIETASVFSSPQVKCETASSGIGAFLDAYQTLLWGMKWLLVPAILVSMSLVVANAIGISVRERYKEIAVLKVLGYRPGQVLVLILGEALLVGGLSGLVSAVATYVYFNLILGGIKFPIAFFPAFFVPMAAFLWGPAIGFTTALLGSFFPSMTARSVKVSEVFSKVA